MRHGAGLLLAGASLGAAAQDATSLQLYGLVGAYGARIERSGDPQAVNQVGHGGLTTSYWGIRGSEGLGGGYKVIFALESFFQTDTGAQGRNANDPMFSRNAYIGVEGGFGKVTVGRQTNPTYINMGMVSPFGISVAFSPLVLHSFVASYNGALIGDTVWNNAIKYATPRTNGFAVNVIYGLGEVAGSSGTANLGLHANYVKGAFTAVLSAQRFRIPVTAPLEEQKGYLAGAAYDFKFVKLHAAMVKSQAEGPLNNTLTRDVGIKIPVTAQGAVLAEFARTKRERAAVPDNVRRTFSLGYDHFLSKRTDVYAIYMRDKQTGFDAGNSVALGLRHLF